jgi:hypothetical protein
LLEQMNVMVANGFLQHQNYSLINTVDSPADLVRQLRS